MRKITFLALFTLQCSSWLFAQKPQLMPPMSHAAYVRALAASPDGKYVLTCAGYLDNTALLWSSDGNLLKILEGHQNDLIDAEISADGKYMLTLETGIWALHLWDNQGKQLGVFKDLNIADACFASGNQQILIGDGGGGLTLLDLKGNPIRNFPGGEAPISEVACSRDGKYLASADEAGLIRVYSLNGTLLKTLNGHGAKPVLAIEFTPDGSRILSGGEDKMALLWNWTEGTVLKKMGPHNTIVRSVAVSPGGDLLATAGPDDDVVNLWDSNGKALRSFRLDKVNELIFTPDGEGILLAPLNKGALLCDLEGRLITEYANDSSPVTSVGFSPFEQDDSLFIATGGQAVHLRLWDALTADVIGFTREGSTVDDGLNENELKHFFSEEIEFNTPVAFTPNAPNLLIGKSGRQFYDYNIYEESLSEISNLRSSSHPALAVSADGASSLISDFEGGIQLWRYFDGKKEWEQAKEWQLPANHATSLAFSSDGTACLIARNRPWSPSLGGYLYDPKAEEQPNEDKGFPATLYRLSDFSTIRTFGTSSDQAVFSADGKYVASNEKYGLSVYNSQTAKEIFHIGSTSDEVNFPMVTSLAFSPDNKSILAGFTSNVIRQYDLTGKLLREFNGHFSTIRSLATSPNGQYLISGSSDNTSKIWNLKTGVELATLMSIGAEDWLITTPEGLFDASPGAMERLYYVADLEIIALDQLKDRYYEPGLLSKIMNLSSGTLRKVADLDNQALALYPEVRSTKLIDDHVDIQLSPRSGGIGRVSMRLDEHIEIEADVNPQRKASFMVDLKQYADYFIAGETNRLSFIYYNKEGWLPSPPDTLVYVPGGSKGKDKPAKPSTISLNDKSDLAIASTLYALVVGTSDYKGTTLDLKYPDLDAAAYKEMLQVSGAGLFGMRMQIKLLSTAKGNTRPSRTAIRAALLDFATKAQPKDVLLVYFSGHGTTWPENDPNSQFYCLSPDNESFDLSVPTNRQLAIAQDSLQAWILEVKARKRILILDACNSGEVVKKLDAGAKGNTLNTDQRRALERMKDRSGFFVLAGSAADKLSYEDPRFGHGLLTYSLLNNMPKVAAANKDNYIDVGKLFQEVRDDVPKLAAALNKVQEPKLIGMEDFSIGLIKNGTPFKLPLAKKIFTRSDFSNKKRLDPLKFKDEVNQQLETMLSNPELPYAYYATDDAAGLHYFVRGEYEVTGTAVKVTAYLYKSDQEKELETFMVEGSSTNVNLLAEQLLDKLRIALEKMK
ncbi:caspase family protein [Haliscomenobacter sp.]|uniref:caspase family protein n=1 Tax=Haliscomenobacter sp. TaxID=2717303 RepID=UPI003364EEE6